MSKQTTVLIAGYADGFGTALRARFSAAGYEVLGVSRQGAQGLQCDLSDPEASATLFSQLDREYTPLAGVIHNAMQFLHEPLLSTSAQQMEDVWRSMVMTAFNTAQQALPRLLAQGGGSLIFTGASGSLRAGPGFAAFSSAKFALRGLSQAIAREHGAQGVHVAHVVIDGLIRSAKTTQRFPGSSAAQLIEPAELAEQYLQLFHQAPSVWTQELDIRPRGGSF